MADPTESCHGAADQSADPRVAPPREAAVVRQCLGETHAASCTQRRGQSDKKRIPGVPSCKSSREDWGQRRHRTIHESGKTRLYDLQNKESSPGLIFIFLDLWAQLFFGQLLRPVLVRALLLSQVIEQLADTGILSPHRGLLIKSTGFDFDCAGLPPDRIEARVAAPTTPASAAQNPSRPACESTECAHQTSADTAR
jgi:hypothetical protein